MVTAHLPWGSPWETVKTVPGQLSLSRFDPWKILTHLLPQYQPMRCVITSQMQLSASPLSLPCYGPSCFLRCPCKVYANFSNAAFCEPSLSTLLRAKLLSQVSMQGVCKQERTHQALWLVPLRVFLTRPWSEVTATTRFPLRSNGTGQGSKDNFLPKDPLHKKVLFNVLVLFPCSTSSFHSIRVSLKGPCLLSGSSDSRGSACNAEDPGSISGSGRSPGGGNGNPF